MQRRKLRLNKASFGRDCQSRHLKQAASLCGTTNQVGLTKSVVENSGRKGSLALQFQGVGPRLYSAVPTVSSGATAKGTEFTLDFSLGGTQAQKARGLAG